MNFDDDDADLALAIALSMDQSSFAIDYSAAATGSGSSDTARTRIAQGNNESAPLLQSAHEEMWFNSEVERREWEERASMELARKLAEEVLNKSFFLV